MTDPRPLLHRALDQMTVLVARPPGLDLPSPCEGWDVRTLLDHVVGVHHRILGVPSDTALQTDSVIETPDGEHAAVLADLRRSIDDAWADDTVLDREVSVPWGRVPVGQAALGFTQELTVHAWDLAVIDGRDGTLDPVLAEAVLEPIRRILPAEGRENVPGFGEVVEVGEDAGPYDRLVGWLGRDPGAIRTRSGA